MWVFFSIVAVRLPLNGSAKQLWCKKDCTKGGSLFFFVVGRANFRYGEFCFGARYVARGLGALYSLWIIAVRLPFTAERSWCKKCCTQDWEPVLTIHYRQTMAIIQPGWFVNFGTTLKRLAQTSLVFQTDYIFQKYLELYSCFDNCKHEPFC